MPVLLRAGLSLTLAGFLASAPVAFAWGENGDRLITNKAVDTLPDDLRTFFEANRQFLTQHVSDPVQAGGNTPADRRSQFIRLEHYGQFPFSGLPRDYKVAVTKFGKRNLDAYGLLPWQIVL